MYKILLSNVRLCPYNLSYYKYSLRRTNKNLNSENVEEKQGNPEVTGGIEKTESINHTDDIVDEDKKINNDAKNSKSSSKQNNQVKLPVNRLEKEKAKKTASSKNIASPNLKLLEDKTNDIEGKYVLNYLTS